MNALLGQLLVLALAVVPFEGGLVREAPRRSPALERPSKSQFPNARGDSREVGKGPLRRFIVETERATKIDPGRFAEKVQAILFARRSWVGSERVALKRIGFGDRDFKVTLATPATTDELCAPLQTNGIFSCYMDGRVVINSWRWRKGAESYGKQRDRYRRYLVNHEVGHALGQSHRSCTGGGDPAPLMVQQTKSLYGCKRNAWPLGWERRSLSP